jgi:hypothetical protein
MLPRSYDYLMEAFVAAVGIVALLATVVGLDDDGIGLGGDVSGTLDLAVQGCRDMV